jgi:zinc protease
MVGRQPSGTQEGPAWRARVPSTTTIPPAVRAATVDQAVPVDPLITVGTLPNGMRYYIRENRQPQARAELRLAVNAGAVLEDDDQRGRGFGMG